MAYYLSSRYRDALTAAERQLARTPDEYFVHAMRAATLAQMGNLDEARNAAAQVRRLEPFFDAKRFGARLVDRGAPREDPGGLGQGRVLGPAGKRGPAYFPGWSLLHVWCAFLEQRRVLLHHVPRLGRWRTH
jgi:tetratricopeptide (TPR) repeat protein